MHARTVARLTGLAYLAMLPGGIGFLVTRSRLLGDTAPDTLSRLVEHPGIAAVGVAAAMVVILAQALSALGFYALFREEHPIVAFGIAGFGLANALAVLAGAAATWTAATLAAPGADAGLVHALLLVDGAAWKLGGLFFGLWLIPMGIGAASTSWFHAGRVLGGILVVGGVAYVLGAFFALSPSLTALGAPDWAAMPATVGELWMMGALVIVGVRTPR